ncbi:hypothetical protein [Streptomyces sp. NPDC002566]|uniref:hypothetical protein n=1 Tax=Streptomyces sp. NPDC002566 TaxID=3364650 RepID=UPI003695E4BF
MHPDQGVEQVFSPVCSWVSLLRLRSASWSSDLMVSWPSERSGVPTRSRIIASATASISRHRWAAAAAAIASVFYDFHLECGTGPLVNPFPLVAQRGRQRAHAHRHPLEPWRNERMGFAKPGSHRDRAMVAL